MSSPRTVVHGVSHVELPVSQLAQAEQLYVQTLGFPRLRGGDGWVDLDAGTLALRLYQSSGAAGRAASLRVQVADVEGAMAAVVAAGGQVRYEAARTPEHEVIGSVLDADGNTLILWRHLSEDEYGYLPDLGTAGTWQPEAEALLKQLLTAVPSLFRALARRRVVKVAEEMCRVRAVTPHDVVRAYILASARVTRGRLREPLRRAGWNPDDFQDDFASDA